jgi:hypothetical protein
MALNLTNLDVKTRALMVKEIDQDIAATRLYLGKQSGVTSSIVKWKNQGGRPLRSEL